MDLRTPAAWFENTWFDGYDEATDTWTENVFQGKVLPVDRFLSNFNRPTRRRTLGLDPSITTIPTSNTIRIPETGAIYMIGTLRQDATKGSAYDQIGILHSSATLGTVNRRAPTGPSTDPGWLVSSTAGTHYMDVELRSVSEVDEQKERFEGDFFVTLPPHASLLKWDQLLIDTKSYFVEEVYDDSGFVFVRAVQRLDPRRDFVYHSRGNTATYDPSTRAITDGLVDSNVTGFAMQYGLGNTDLQALKEADLVVVVDVDHIGVVPTSEDELTWEGQKYKVEKVAQDFLQEQYQLHCTL